MGLVNLAARVSLQGVSAVQSGLRTIRSEFQKLAADAKEVGQSVGGLAQKLQSIGSSAVGFARNIALAGSVAATGLGVFAFNTASQMDSLTRGMASVSNNADDLRGQMAQLKEIAKLPGLSFEEAVQGALALQSVGLSADVSQRALASFGNALASVGRGSAELGGVITALSQIVSKGTVSAEEINQIAERVPQVRRLLKDAFGTADTQAIQKMGIGAAQAVEMLVSAAEKLPKVSGGIGNLLENLIDKAKQTFRPLGDGLAAMFESAMPAIERILGGIEGKMRQIGEVFAALGKSGVLADTLSKLVGAAEKLFGGDFRDGMTDFLTRIVTIAGNLPAVFEVAGQSIAQFIAALRTNIGALADNISQAMQAVAGNIGALTDSTFTNMGLRSQAFWESQKVSFLDFFTHGLDYLPETQKKLNAIGKKYADMEVKPEIKGVPKLTDGMVAFPSLSGEGGILDKIMKTGTQGMEYNLARVLAAGGPLSDIPNGVNFGGRYLAADGNGNQKSPIDELLSKIEKNTAKSADELTLRRRAIGGGELARIGVTAAELGRYGVSGNAPSAGDYGGLAADAAIKRVLKQLLREETMQRSGGKPR